MVKIYLLEFDEIPDMLCFVEGICNFINLTPLPDLILNISLKQEINIKQ